MNAVIFSKLIDAKLTIEAGKSSDQNSTERRGVVQLHFNKITRSRSSAHFCASKAGLTRSSDDSQWRQKIKVWDVYIIYMYIYVTYIHIYEYEHQTKGPSGSAFKTHNVSLAGRSPLHQIRICCTSNPLGNVAFPKANCRNVGLEGFANEGYNLRTLDVDGCWWMLLKQVETVHGKKPLF